MEKMETKEENIKELVNRIEKEYKMLMKSFNFVNTAILGMCEDIKELLVYG